MDQRPISRPNDSDLKAATTLRIGAEADAVLDRPRVELGPFTACSPTAKVVRAHTPASNPRMRHVAGCQFPGPGVAGNIGLNLAMGIGAGVVPIDVGGGVSYSWPLS